MRGSADPMVREATPADVPQIMRASRSTDRFRMSEYTASLDRSELLYWINDTRSIVLVLTAKSDVLGYAIGHFVSPKWFFFDEFLVLSGVQRTGLGKLLYDNLRQRCGKRGCELIQGLIKDDGMNTVPYWTKRGFEVGARCHWVEDWLT